MGAVVFHITTRPAWEDARAAGRHEDPSLEREGFIHCSTLEQVAGSADAHFAGVRDLVLLCIEPARLVYEYSEDGGGVFPHLYGPLNADAVVAVVPIEEGEGGFVAPSEAARLAR